MVLTSSEPINMAENPKPPARKFSLEKLSGFVFGMSESTPAAGTFDFAGFGNDLSAGKANGLSPDSAKPLAVPMISVTGVGNATDNGDDQSAKSPPMHRSASTPAMKLLQTDNAPSSDPATNTSIISPANVNPSERRRRVSGGDRPHGQMSAASSKTGLIMNWLAYRPMARVHHITESDETEQGTPPTQSGFPSSFQTSAGSPTSSERPITDAVLASMKPAVTRKLSAPTGLSDGILRDMNVLSPSNW